MPTPKMPKTNTVAPQILILHEKHGDRYIWIRGNDKKDLDRIARKILKERTDEQWPWYFDPDLSEARQILKSNISGQAWAFLKSREGDEYEGFDISQLELM